MQVSRFKKEEDLSYKTEVIADNTGNWVGNGLRFATNPEAEAYVSDLSYRWTSVRETRVVKCDDEVNYEWKAGKAWPLITGEPVK